MVERNILVELAPKSCSEVKFFFFFFLKYIKNSLLLVAHVEVITVTKFKR